MVELREGIFRLLQRLIGGSSLTLAIVYTVGHIIVAAIVAYIITGTSIKLAALDAIVEPIINGIWFYVLHSAYKKYKGIK
tara:strand:- start:291 stop:530 length:240 start_codon:yes stop_codon:yes gene_type:complete